MGGVLVAEEEVVGVAGLVDVLEDQAALDGGGHREVKVRVKVSGNVKVNRSDIGPLSPSRSHSLIFAP